jgi:hypothetical protein
MWAPVLSSLAESHATGETLVRVGAALGGVAVVATLVLAGRLGFQRMWRQTIIVVLGGTFVLLFWYVAVTLAAPDPTNQNDHAVGVGMIILALPTAALVGLPVGLGALGGRAVARVLARRHKPGA